MKFIDYDQSDNNSNINAIEGLQVQDHVAYKSDTSKQGPDHIGRSYLNYQ